jgi:hypothetical protein
MAMGPWGLHYERTQTWWEYSTPWHEYLSRCQFLLQQGLFSADICYVGLEDSPQRWQVPGKSRERPGYNYDGCPAEIVINRMTVKNGRLVLPSGMTYRVLVLPESETMTPRLLNKVKQLVADGATVIGSRPLRAPGLADYPDCDSEVRRIASEFWADCDGKTVKEHRFGQGRVICGRTAEAVLASEVPKDFDSESKNCPQSIRYTHRIVGDADLYFLANKYSQPEEAVCAFRVTGKSPSFWHPDNGKTDQIVVYSQTNGTTRIPVHFDPFGSMFVLFQPSTGTNRTFQNLYREKQQQILTTSFKPTQLPAGLTNETIATSFAIAAWVKADIEVDLPKEETAGISGLHVVRNDALYPPSSEDFFDEPNHAYAGISAGKNGVCVYEHGANYFAPTLVWPATLTNWTHVAVVYTSNTPSLFLNGKLVHQGLHSDFVVHSAVGVQHTRGVAPFRGALGTFEQFRNKPGTDPLQVPIAPAPTPPAEHLAMEQIAKNSDGDLIILARSAGDYEGTGPRPVRIHVDPIVSPIEIPGPWAVAFPPGLGAPPQITLTTLISWTQHPDPGVKFFSGVATYRTAFPLPAVKEKDLHLYLNLGEVAVMARPKLNGHDLGILWKPPFEAEITPFLREGENALEVEVVNLWPNRMIGDEQLPEDSKRKPNGTLEEWPEWLLKNEPSPTGRHSFTTWRLWKQDSVLQSSGLLGPVTITAAREVTIRP